MASSAPDGPDDRGMRLRLVASLVALAAGVIGVVVATLLVQGVLA